MERQNFDFSTIVTILRKNIKVFIVVIIASAVLAVIFSSSTFLKPRFKSVAVVYPINIRPYSDESETEQLLQMFEAGSVRDSIIEKFELYRRYDIKKGDPSSKYYMNLEYNDRVVSSKTSYESVVLEVFDESPDTARLMADEILVQLNNKIRAFYNERGIRRSEAFKRQMDYQTMVIDTLQQKIQKLAQEKGLVNYESQARELMKGYIDAYSASPNSERTKEMRKWLDDLQSSGSSFQAMQELSTAATDQYSFIAEKFLDWRAIGYEDVNYIDVVVSPDVPDKKAWPIRWLIVLLTVAVGSFITLIILAAAKKY